MRHISCIPKAMEPTGVHNSTSTRSRCHYPAHICAVCLSGGTYTRLGSITRAPCTARFVPFYKQRTHQLSDAPRRPGRSGRPVIQLGLPVSLVGCWSFGWSVGSVHRLSRAATGRSGGWSVARSVGQSDGSVGPPDRSVGSADRSAGRWVGRRHRADTEASVISPTTSHSNSEHCPRKKTSRWQNNREGAPLLSAPPMLRGGMRCGSWKFLSSLSIGGLETSRVRMSTYGSCHLSRIRDDFLIGP